MYETRPAKLHTELSAKLTLWANRAAIMASSALTTEEKINLLRGAK